MDRNSTYYKSFLNIFQGMIMGVAEVVPGINSSTFALIMGIYDDLINLLYSASIFAKDLLLFITRRVDSKQLKKSFYEIPWRFGLALVFGMVLTVGIFSHIMVYFLDEYPQYVFALFFGLALASVTIPLGELKQRTPINFGIMIVSFAISFFIFGLTPNEDTSSPSYLILLIGGFFSVAGLILPGVNGSFVMIYFGVYDYVIELVKHFTKLEINSTRIAQVATFSVGFFIGFFVFITTVKKAFDKYPDRVLSLIIGLMFGTLRMLNPFFVYADDKNTKKDFAFPFEQDKYSSIVVILLILVGIITIFALNYMQVDRKQIEKIEE